MSDLVALICSRAGVFAAILGHAMGSPLSRVGNEKNSNWERHRPASKPYKSVMWTRSP
jgi:hypothetical protein